jgi:hypothetical protein
MPLQRPGDVNGRDPAGRANRYAKAGFKEPITLILGQAPSALSILEIRVPSIGPISETGEYQGGFPGKKSLLCV